MRPALLGAFVAMLASGRLVSAAQAADAPAPSLPILASRPTGWQVPARACLPLAGSDVDLHATAGTRYPRIAARIVTTPGSIPVTIGNSSAG